MTLSQTYRYSQKQYVQPGMDKEREIGLATLLLIFRIQLSLETSDAPYTGTFNHSYNDTLRHTISITDAYPYF